MNDELSASAVVPTGSAGRYVKQLVAHLGHKAEVRSEPEGQRLLFSTGSCLLVSRQRCCTAPRHRRNPGGSTARREHSRRPPRTVRPPRPTCRRLAAPVLNSGRQLVQHLNTGPIAAASDQVGTPAEMIRDVVPWPSLRTIPTLLARVGWAVGVFSDGSRWRRSSRCAGLPDDQLRCDPVSSTVLLPVDHGHE
jgi:hypothetical protein